MRLYMREYRAKKRVSKSVETAPYPDDPVKALVEWSETKLRVPPGHPRAGEPLTLPDYGVSFLSDALTARESLLTVARKNAKSAIVAVYLLGRLVGPLRFHGWRGGVASMSKEKAGELKRQVEQIAEASGLDDLTFYRSPAPGRVVSSTGSLDLLAADCGAHSSGLDDAVFDELGLVPESQRDFVASLRSSTSAKNGRFIALSIWGFGPFIPEMVARRGSPGVAVHLYQPEKGAAIDDERAWHKANPGLKAGIKSLDHMRHESARVLATPSDQAFFLAHEMNLPQHPGKQLIVSPADWEKCLQGKPDRRGRCVVGFDLGGSAAMCSLVAYWIDSGRVECYAAFPGFPSLEARGKRDGVGNLYCQLEQAGELWAYEGTRVTPVAQFLEDCADQLNGSPVIVAGADRYRKAEAEEALQKASVPWPVTWRGTGASKTADGSYDVRAFQRLVMQGKWHVTHGAAVLTQAIAGASVRFDEAGNPALDKQKGLARIDPLQAGVIAAGLGLMEAGKPKPKPARVAFV